MKTAIILSLGACLLISSSAISSTKEKYNFRFDETAPLNYSNQEKRGFYEKYKKHFDGATINILALKNLKKAITLKIARAMSG